MKWIIALVVAAGLTIALPWAITASKRSARGKGRLAGAAFAIGLAFGAMFDPAKSAAIENIQKEKEIGDEAEDAAAPPDRAAQAGLEAACLAATAQRAVSRSPRAIS